MDLISVVMRPDLMMEESLLWQEKPSKVCFLTKGEVLTKLNRINTELSEGHYFLYAYYLSTLTL